MKDLLKDEFDPTQRYHITVQGSEKSAGDLYVNRQDYHEFDHSAAEIEMGATIRAASKHKDEHFEQYVETARQEAEAQGIEVNLPKEK